ncbi:unnamed protein product [Brassica oleracea]
MKHLKPKVTEEINKDLTRPVTENELFQAIRQMDREKVPGPDGLNPGFYKDHWETIKTEEGEGRKLMQIYENASGKEVLLKAVATAIPAYSMSCFLLPKRVLNQMTKAMRKFWWSSAKDKQGIPWIAWSTIADSKSLGGLGIRDLTDFNIALVAKQSWRILQNPKSLLSRVYKSKYFQKTSLLQAKPKSNGSHAWKSILKDPEDVEIIKTIRPSITGASDSTFWIHTKDGQYSAKSENLRKRKMMADSTCQLCGEHQETTNHLIFQCRVSKEIWSMTPSIQISDGSWTSPTDNAGIGWALFSTDGRIILEGKAAIEPVNSPLDAEAEALRMAVVQMRKLGYHIVTFYGDSSEIYDTLSNSHQASPSSIKRNHCPTYMKDIANLAKDSNYSFGFQKVKRTCNGVADKLAKEGRITNSGYVVRWKNNV